ncbi:hypothetical protein K3152_00110 [Qipengyuania sp. 1NDH17]|uniref:Uncharacterized protein n=1 Tax=Qipengyuania polymorpha TaxID=2867234 RepID=A0ABS7IXW0_9SPHN|nr:hypothetical protein [Qipengyuania polymorpha]MBX7456639.1 hypothetical protein [Qipengyuania polymorpha]
MQAQLKPVSDFSAWEHYHTGLTKTFDHGPVDPATALDHIGRAIELDPGFARACRAGACELDAGALVVGCTQAGGRGGHDRCGTAGAGA